MPKQPIEYSHALHAGKLGIDCRYCHTTVESSGHAAVPAVQTCMNCHAKIGKDNPKLAPLRQAWVENKQVEWVKVHKLPDYVYFNHSAHVTRGIGCVSCHGRVDTMEKVYQHENLSMGWCLSCHRSPENHLRPKDKVTLMDWKPVGRTQRELGKDLRKENHINPSTDCSTCHR
ncbi:MAG TPA: cytochrome c3 family protein [Planctomycetota bacterium]|nr:cytochrome c3 family protein [Planctomycetota bacterium]